MKIITMTKAVLLGIVGLVVTSVPLLSAAANSFEECAAAGYPVTESYPRRCTTPDGTSFVEILPPQSSAPERPAGDSDVVCTLEAKQCPNGSYVQRFPPDCEFAPCPE